MALRGRAAAAFRAAGLLLLLAVAAVCLPAAAPRLAGLHAYAVTSGSMEPAIPTGSMVYVRETDPSLLEEGDVAVFYGAGGCGEETCHRVVGNDREAGELTTRGDANRGEDPLPVPYDAVLGKVEYHVPYLGRLLPLISGGPGKGSLVCLLFAGLFLRIIGTRRQAE